MTTGALLTVLARRWYVVVAVLAVAGYLFVALARSGGAYTVDMQVQLVPPESQAIGPENDWQQETLVNVAAAVESAFHDWHQPDRVAESASLFGSGVNAGYQVLLQNVGGQWESSYPRPLIDVHVVEHSSTEALTTTEQILQRLEFITADLQRAVPPAERITVVRIPAVPEVAYAGRSTGTTLRALGAFGIVAIGSAALAAVLLDRCVSRVRPEHRPRSTPRLLPTKAGTS